MTSTLNTHQSKADAESHTSYSSCFLYDDANVAPIDPYVDALGGIYTSSTSTKTSNYNPYPQNNTFPTEEAAAALDSQFAGAIYSPPTPKYCAPVPFTTSSNGVDSTLFNGWQVEADSLMQTSPGMQWWRGPIFSGSNNYTAPYSRTLKPSTSNTNHYNPESISLSNAAAHESQLQGRADSLHLSSARKRRKCGAAASSQETNFMSKDTVRRIAPTYPTDPSKIPTASASDVSFDPPDTDAQPGPRPPEDPKRASPIEETQQITHLQAPPAASRPGQRARNRTAAIKCRTKTKAAAAELAATEKAESSRHEVLLVTLRGLQEDVFALKSEILLHGNCGDGLIQDYLNNTARSLATG